MRALVRILGPVGLVGTGGEVELGGPKERCLLTVLTLHAGAVVAEDRLVEALWTGSPPRTAAKTLQNYVLRLRRRIEGCGDAAIVTRPPGYVLEGLTTDAAAARVLVAEGRRLAERGEDAAAAGRVRRDQRRRDRHGRHRHRRARRRHPQTRRHAAELGPIAVAVQRAVKDALDPLGILNPGKVVGKPGGTHLNPP